MGNNNGLQREQSVPTLIPGVRSHEPAADQVRQIQAANAKRLEITKSVDAIACDKDGREVRLVKIRMHHGAIVVAARHNAIAAIERGDAELVKG